MKRSPNDKASMYLKDTKNLSGKPKFFHNSISESLTEVSPGKHSQRSNKDFQVSQSCSKLNISKCSVSKTPLSLEAMHPNQDKKMISLHPFHGNDDSPTKVNDVSCNRIRDELLEIVSPSLRSDPDDICILNDVTLARMNSPRGNGDFRGNMSFETQSYRQQRNQNAKAKGVQDENFVFPEMLSTSLVDQKKMDLEEIQSKEYYDKETERVSNLNCFERKPIRKESQVKIDDFSCNDFFTSFLSLRNIHNACEDTTNSSQNRKTMMHESNVHSKRTVNSVVVESPLTQSDVLANDAALLFRGLEPMLENARNGSTDATESTFLDKKVMATGIHSPSRNDVELGVIDHGSYGSSTKIPEQLKGIIKGLFHNKVTPTSNTVNYLDNFLTAKRKTTIAYAKSVFTILILPATAVSIVLFYGLGNPLMKSGQDPVTNAYPSISWFILFLCVRQVITFSFAKLTEMLLIDLVALKTRFLLRILGPLVSLIIVQSKGWPCTVIFWSLFDLTLLAGDGPFPNHWMFYQTSIDLFNAKNPSGGVTSSMWNYRILVASMVIGVMVSIKRFVIGMYLGGKQYSSYGSKMSEVMEKMVLIGEVAKLARSMERDGSHLRKKSKGFYRDLERSVNGKETHKEKDFEDLLRDSEALDGPESPTRNIQSSIKSMLLKNLDDWEEPSEERKVSEVSLADILRFKQSLAFMDESYPFSKAFGLANTRENCLQSAIDIYNCLIRRTPSLERIHFTTLLEALTYLDSKTLVENRIKQLIRIFRPEQDRTLDLVSFVKSVDNVYKELRLLRASIRNSSQIDSAFEAIINIGFYFIIFCVMLASWGIDPLKIFLSLSSVILAFSFAIGSASAKYFEGLIFILGRKPFDVGDRISINGPNEAPMSDGPCTWYVEEVTLYYTTLRLGATNEVATVSNSSLANSRIVNAARSTKAVVYIKLKFGIDVPTSKIEAFKDRVENFVKARPREWLSSPSIRASRVEADLGFIEYVISLHHRDSWQHMGNIVSSKADVTSYCLEVQNELEIKYVAPPTPVHLSLTNSQISLSELK